jgi:hypothetical protein
VPCVQTSTAPLLGLVLEVADATAVVPVLLTSVDLLTAFSPLLSQELSRDGPTLLQACRMDAAGCDFINKAKCRAGLLVCALKYSTVVNSIIRRHNVT